MTGLDISDELLTQFAAELASVAGTGPDRLLSPEIEQTVDLVTSGAVLTAAKSVVDSLR